MSEALAVELVLALYSASYQSPAKPLPTITVSKGKEPQPPKKSRSIVQGTGSTINPFVHTIQVVKPPPPVIIPKGIPLPKPGTLDAYGFFMALKNAGLRRHPESGMLIRHLTLILPDEKIAIMAFIGYSFGSPHGAQLEVARHKARFTLRPEKSKEEYKRGVAATLAGFIKGCPDIALRHQQDLLAREQQASNLLIEYERSANECQDKDEKLIFTGKALVERERLSVIRQDLIDLVCAHGHF